MMKPYVKNLIALMLAAVLLIGAFACAKPAQVETPNTETMTAHPTDVPAATDTPAVNEPEATAEPAEEPEVPTEALVSSEPVRVAALTGPTGVGLSYLMKISDAYTLDLYSAPDQVVAKFVSGETDVAAVPINLASTLYKKTNGNVAVIAVNTLGVLYFVDNGDMISDVTDLAGKTVYATGQASTPQYILEKILADYGLIDQVTVDYVAEASALAAQLAEDNDTTIAFLPEPMVSVACAKAGTVRVALSANELWKANNDTEIVQGVYIVRKDFLTQNPAAVDRFLTDADESVNLVLTDENAADAVVEAGVIPQAPIAKKAIPNCNIVLITGSEMKTMVSAMLNTLFAADPKSVGGALPAEDIYYVP